MFDTEVCRLIRLAALGWRERFLNWLEEIHAAYGPRRLVGLEALAGHFNVVAGGSIITPRAIADKSIVARQARLMRYDVKLLFSKDADFGR